MLLFNPLSMEVTALVVIFCFVSVMVASQNRARERREKLRIIEEAIRSGNLDAATQQEFVAELTGRRPEVRPSESPAASPRSAWARLAFGIGWLCLFVGLALLAIDDRDALYAGIVVAVIGFGLVTLPLALRELDRDPTGSRGSRRT